LPASRPLGVLGRLNEALGWLAVLLIAVLLASGLNTATPSLRFIVAHAELAPRDDRRVDIVRPETQIATTKRAPYSSPDGGSASALAVLALSEELSPTANQGRCDALLVRKPFARRHHAAQARAPPSPASVG
jgi:hypothetical protein